MTELLIVLDDDVLRSWVERVVRERGYSCDAATNAADARELLAQDSYKLVLLDVDAPDEPCIVLLSHIHSDHPNAAVVVIGEDDPRLATIAVEHGALDYIVKPVGSGELLVRVANAVRRRPPARIGSRSRTSPRRAGSSRQRTPPSRS
jgi:DNA-binding response OmpR family regulator